MLSSKQGKPQYQWPKRSGFSPLISDTHKGSSPCYDSGPRLNLDPKLSNNITLDEDCQE